MIGYTECFEVFLRPESFPHNMFVTQSAARLCGVVVSGQVTGAMTSERGRLAQQLLMPRLLLVAAAGLVASSVSISSLFASATANISLWVGCLCVWSLRAVTEVRGRFTSSPAALRHQQIEEQSSSPTHLVLLLLCFLDVNILKKKKKKPSVATLTSISVEVNVRF